jgi:hypothetical protein
MKIFLESREEKLYEITIDEFLKKTKKFVNGELTKSEAAQILNETFKEIYRAVKENSPDKIWTMIVESKPTEGKGNYKIDYAAIDIVQQFIIYYATELTEVLCQNALNPHYVKTSGNPALTDINLYGIKRGNNSIIIKSFIFGTVPKTEELYVSTTCGTGGTSVLFDRLKELIVDKGFYEAQNNKIKYIHLDSLEKAPTIGFYSMLGFYKTNKNTNKILKDMINSVYRKSLLYEDYIRKTDLDIGGAMYWSDDAKVLKKLKCSYEYSPELWYKNINNMKKQKIPKSEVLNHFYTKYHELKGAGIPEELV